MWSKFEATGRFAVVEALRSKRNAVLLLRDKHRRPLVFKAVEDGAEEIGILRHLAEHGVAVPAVLEEVEPPPGVRGFFLEYVVGEPLCDYLEQQEKLGVPVLQLLPVMKAWVQWLQTFYASMAHPEQRRLQDVNLRNFLWEPIRGRFTGVDFEHCPPGFVEDDLGGIAAFLLTYDPVFTPWKLQLTRLFLQLASEMLAVDDTMVRRAAEEQLRILSLRREQKFPVETLQEII